MMIFVRTHRSGGFLFWAPDRTEHGTHGEPSNYLSAFGFIYTFFGEQRTFLDDAGCAQLFATVQCADIDVCFVRLSGNSATFMSRRRASVTGRIRFSCVSESLSR